MQCHGKRLGVHGLALFVVMALWMIVGTGHARAQTSHLKITIARPGEGETIYTPPSAPFARVPVIGYVSADDIAVTQLQVRLEVVQGTKTFATLTTAPDGNGKYTFEIAVNSDSPIVHLECAEPACHNATPYGFPPGPVILRATVSDPSGHQATALRSVTVEHSGYANVPVQVQIAGAPNDKIAGLDVTAATRIYDWARREFSTKTDAQGQAVLEVEALGQQPTRYAVRIDPIVVNGVLYRTRQPVQFTLPLGAKTGQLITLIAEAQRGQITGTINSTASLKIRAIQLPIGVGLITLSEQGTFNFADLPIGKYVVSADDAPSASQTIDLTANPTATVTLALANQSARSVRGIVRNDRGNPLPLAWVTTDDHTQTVMVSPASGAFALYGLTDQTRSLSVTAPGYWSRPVALTGNTLDISLDQEPETRVVPWGTGSLTLPSQTIATLADNRLTLRRGWVWGIGSGPLSVSTHDLDINLSGGSFALSYLPGETNWLYVLDGQATAGQTTINAGQMLAFGKDVTQPSPVPLEDATVWTLHNGEPVPVSVATNTAIGWQVRDAVEQFGIPFTWVLVLTAGALGATILLLFLRMRSHSIKQAM